LQIKGYDVSATWRQALATLVWPLLTTASDCDSGNKGFCGAIYQNNVASPFAAVNHLVAKNCQDCINHPKGRVATPAGYDGVARENGMLGKASNSLPFDALLHEFPT